MATEKIWLEAVQERSGGKRQVIPMLVLSVFFISSGAYRLFNGSHDFLPLFYLVIGVLSIPACVILLYRPHWMFFNQPPFIEFQPDQLTVKTRFLTRARVIPWDQVGKIDFKPGHVIMTLREESSPIFIRPYSYSAYQEIHHALERYASENGIQIRHWDKKS